MTTHPAITRIALPGWSLDAPISAHPPKDTAILLHLQSGAGNHCRTGSSSSTATSAGCRASAAEAASAAVSSGDIHRQTGGRRHTQSRCPAAATTAIRSATTAA